MNATLANLHSKDNSHLISTSNKVTNIDEGFLELSGYSKYEIVDKDLSDVFINLLRIPQKRFEEIGIKDSTECYIFTKSLEVREVAISFLQVQDAENVIYSIAEKPNSRLDDKLIFVEHLFIDNIKGCAVYSVPDLILLKVNQKYLYACDPPFNKKENSIGRPISEFVTGYVGSQAEVVWNTIIDKQKPNYMKEFIYDGYRSGISYWDATQTPIFEKGKMKYIFEVTENVTERVLVRHQTEDFEKTNNSLKKAIDMKDEFLSIISHEFKTPITVINSAIQAMELICKNELSDKVREYLKKIRQNTNRQLKLVNNLLDITRINAGNFKINKRDMDIILLTRAITESITIFAEQKSVKLSFSSTLREKIIGIDEEKFERILLNLLSNAVKFTPKGKSISVRVSLKVVERKHMLCIKVKDKGIGIPEDKQELIFERFGQVDSTFTRQAEGTGIGLHLVKMFVEMMGGEITLESKIGVGSTFTILLPIKKVKDTPIEQIIKEITDNRLIQSTAIEFSDIYS